VAAFAPWALALIAAATFARGIGYGFVFDDIIVLCKSERIRELSSAYEVFVRPSQWIISDAANSRLMTYRPLALGSMVLEFVAFGGAPWIFHLTNVALHVACVVLFWRLLLDTNTSAATSFALALLFAVHPVGSEAITWINGRSEPICLLFGLVVLSLCTRASPLTAPRFVAIAMALCFSLLGKETGLAFLVLGCGFLARHRDRRVLAVGSAALFVGLAAYWLLRSHALSGVHHQLALSASTFSVIPPLWSRALQAAVWPIGLGLENLAAWMRGATVLDLLQFELTGALLVCATILGWIRGRTLTSIGLAWWLATLAAPSLTFATGVYWPGLCRWVYVALPGLLLALAPWSDRYLTQTRIYGLAAVLAIGLAFEAQRAIAVWRTDATLMGHMAAKYPGDSLAAYMASRYDSGYGNACPRGTGGAM
jgi:protein O-mannosyl-transferase